MSAATRTAMNAAMSAALPGRSNRVIRGGALPRIALLTVGLLLPLPACRHSHVSGTASTDAVLDAFKASGFDVGQMKVVEPDPWTADHCVSGKVSELQVLVCEFKTDEALAGGESEVRHGWDSVNVDTGVVLHNGRTMLVIADAAKRDPNGRAIARLLNAFRALP